MESLRYNGDFFLNQNKPLEEIIEKSKVQSLLLSSYVADIPWLIKNWVPLDKHFTLIHGMRGLEMPNIQNFTFISPKINGYGVHHTKIMLIQYQKFIRVVISTANLIPEDFKYRLQGYWIQDFPQLNLDQESNSNNNNNDFRETLQDYLSHVGENRFFQLLNNYDFSEAKGVLISSVPGSHYGNKYGHLKLRSELLRNKYNKDQNQHGDNIIIAQFTSVGSTNGAWLEELETSFTNNNNDNDNNKQNINIRYVWPTVPFVAESIGGYLNGGTLHLEEKNYHPILQKKFYEFKPREEFTRYSPHIKTYFAYHLDDDNSIRIQWFCLTSANLSKAAWGSLNTKGDKLWTRNYEMGILVINNNNSNISDFPVPINLREEFMLNKYPWIKDQKYEIPDLYGNVWPFQM